MKINHPSQKAKSFFSSSLLLLFMIILFSCQLPGKETQETISEIPQDHRTVDSKPTTTIYPPSTTNSTLPATQEPQPSSLPSSTLCTEDWVCISSSQKIHRLANCSFAERETCKFGCMNDACTSAPVCTSGFKCKNMYERGYQLEDCSWISRSKCDYGCENAVCMPKPNVTEENSGYEASSPAPPTAPSYPVIAVGETKVITVRDNEHQLKIYILEPDQVRLQLDSFKSDWIPEQGSFTFGSVGVTLVIKSIFFQSFEGGKREVMYEVK